MSTEKVIKDFCPVKKIYVEIIDTRPYPNQRKLLAEKLHDKFPNLLCRQQQHCYQNGSTPSGCLYESITESQPPMPGDLYEWISKTECVVKGIDPNGNTFFSHQTLKDICFVKKWCPCCSRASSLEFIRSHCTRYGGPGIVVANEEED